MVDSMQIINDYGDFLLLSPSSDIRDVSLLPYPKADIKEAIFLNIKEGVDEETYRVFATGLYLLADFQVGVGSIPLSILGVDISKLPEDNKGWIKLMNAVANNPNQEKYWSFYSIVEKERSSIKGELATLSFIDITSVSQGPQKVIPKDEKASKCSFTIRWNYGSISLIIFIIFAVINYVFNFEQNIWILVFSSLCITPAIDDYVNKRI